MKTVYERLPAAQDRLLTGIIHHAPTAGGQERGQGAIS